ncbi:unnamed protein product [Miscanthus lutarioriparius]|uniref:Uncharacterized protein n=1 Tax=Miscanthus lutarioriparius TaxID=422564 RepID=A0A811RS96_9POAL|nr:unnamed protein product [Miscanthus lutarioriparius]
MPGPPLQRKATSAGPHGRPPGREEHWPPGPKPKLAATAVTSRRGVAACSGPKGRDRLCADRRARRHRGSGRQRQAADAAANCAEFGHGCRRHRCVLREASSAGPRTPRGVASRRRRSVRGCGRVPPTTGRQAQER